MKKILALVLAVFMIAAALPREAAAESAPTRIKDIAKVQGVRSNQLIGYGIVVGLAVLFAYLIFFYRAWKIAKESTGTFGRLLAFGVGFWLTSQALVHIGVNCELLPTTGQTLPFVSSGGASILVSGIAVGMILNVAKFTATEREREDPMAILRNNP